MSRLIVPATSLLALALAATSASLPAAEGIANAEPGESPNVTAMRALRSKTSFHVEIMPLSDFAKFLTQKYKIRFRLDRSGLQRAGVDPSTPVSAEIEEMQLSAALQQILGRLNLAHRVVNGLIVVSQRPPQPAPVVRARRVRMQNGRMMIIQQGAQGLVQIQEQQILQQLRPQIAVELVFAKGTCGATKEQMRRLKEDLMQYVKDADNEFAQLRQGRAATGESAIFRARQLLQRRLAGAVEKYLSPTQAALYRTELVKRTAYEHAVWARSLVTLLDRELCLTAHQRDAIVASLSGQWDEAWSQTVEMAAMQGQNYLPALPDGLIEPHLDAAQTEVWENLQKVGNVNWGFQQFHRGFFGIPIPDFEDD